MDRASVWRGAVTPPGTPGCTGGRAHAALPDEPGVSALHARRPRPCAGQKSPPLMRRPSASPKPSSATEHTAELRSSPASGCRIRPEASSLALEAPLPDRPAFAATLDGEAGRRSRLEPLDVRDP